jgi:hypothetical protein
MFDITTFTLIHVVLSLVGIFAGLIVAGGVVAGKRLDGWTGAFLASTVLTSVTGFGFPFVSLLPVGAVLALYLNVFVLLAQLFLRLPALIVAAPTQKEPPFLVT